MMKYKMNKKRKKKVMSEENDSIESWLTFDSTQPMGIKSFMKFHQGFAQMKQ